jgi:hypothetical protein
VNIQHSSRSDSWRTPRDIITRCKLVLEGIDLDPASDAEANRTVLASAYYTEADDALSLEWRQDCSVFLNPPGGKIGNKSKVALFWQKLMDYRDSGSLKHAIFLAFSIEALQHTQDKGCKPIAEFPFCVPAKRIAFVSADGSDKNAPSHSNMIVYVPGTVDATEEFRQTFQDLGCVLNTRRHP